MDKNVPKLTTTTAVSPTTTITGPTGSTHEETGLNLELGCSVSQAISSQEGAQFLQFGFPADYSDSSMFPVYPLGIEQSGSDNVGPSVGCYFESFQGNTGVGTTYRPEPICLSSKSKAHQLLIKWPSSITKAARSKRRIARRMGSSGSSSSSYPSLSLSSLSPISDEQAFPANNNDGEDTTTVTTSENKTLRFLFQKELKNSDVGSLGRIVLPKKEAEAHLPNLTVKEGIQIAVRDVSSSTTIWYMRYRFWPNNSSRMYVLENTGDFVKQKGLQSGDSIMVYEDENKELRKARGMHVWLKPLLRSYQELVAAAYSRSHPPYLTHTRGKFIRGNKAERKPVTVRPGFLVSRPLYYAPLLQQQQRNQRQIQRQQQFYYIPQTQSRDNMVEVAQAQHSATHFNKHVEGGSSDVGVSSSLDAAGAASSTFRTTAASLSLSSVVAIDALSTAQLPTAEGVEKPLLSKDAISRGDEQEVMAAYGSLFTDFDDSVFGELEMLPNFGSLYDYLMKEDDDDIDKDDTAPAI